MQESFPARLASDARYERALQGLRLLVRHQGAQLVQTLLAWRQGAADEIRKAYGVGGGVSGGLSAVGVCKRAAAELVFLDAAELVLASAGGAFAEGPQYAAFFDHVLQ